MHCTHIYPCLSSLSLCHSILLRNSPLATHDSYHPHTQYPPPIHHTLENATITYDTMVMEHSKDLVKDVFFSPAMTTTEARDSEGSSICGQSDSDESDVASFSPSDLLQDDDPLFLLVLILMKPLLQPTRAPLLPRNNHRRKNKLLCLAKGVLDLPITMILSRRQKQVMLLVYLVHL